MQKFHFAILKNEAEDDHILWEQACLELGDYIEYELIELSAPDWLEQLSRKPFDGALASPPGWTMAFKTLYDERLAILNSALGIPVYPSVEEVWIYENKKYLSYWLAAHAVPHPKTTVFYYLDQALNFLETSPLPLVGKNNIGAGGSGVVILKTKKEAVNYVKKVFSGRGASRQVGPKWRKKGFVKRVFNKLLRPAELKAKLDHYKYVRSEVQKDFAILQEYIPHSFEWRVVRIGDSFFAHKKMIKGEMTSGSLIKDYANPPLKLLDFVKEVTGKGNFLSQAVDIFETAGGRYLVNEMQCIFGQSDPYQMLVDGKAGRYRFINDEWIFEAGDFNRVESHILRLEHFMEILANKHQEVQV